VLLISPTAYSFLAVLSVPEDPLRVDSDLCTLPSKCLRRQWVTQLNVFSLNLLPCFMGEQLLQSAESFFFGVTSFDITHSLLPD